MADDSMQWLSQVKFWILIVLTIPSAICSILILIYFFQRRNNISPHHHVIIVLIVTSLFQIVADMTSVMAYYHRGQVIPASSAFCTWWNWAEYASNGVLRWSMAWGSIERHLLVFNHAMTNTRQKRIVFHICPMILVCLYPCLFYFSVMVLNSCQNRWDYKTVEFLLALDFSEQCESESLSARSYARFRAT